MDLKKTGAALLAVAAIGAALASSAFAAATTTDVKWYVGPSPGEELGVFGEALSVEAEENWTLAFPLAGIEVAVEWGSISVVEGRITNAEGKASGFAKLKLGGVKLTKPEPAKCSVASSITTKTITFQPDWMIGSTDYWRFGEESELLSFEIMGAECPLSTKVILKGSVFMQTTNSTGTQAVTQPVKSSAEINATAGGKLRVGSETASLKGSAKFKLAGGQAFGTH